MSGYELGRAALVDAVLELPAHEELTLPKSAIPHPLGLGFDLSLGEPHGQAADYRAELPDGRGLHLRDMTSHWSIHWDHVFPSLERWVDHLREDSPAWFVVLIAGILIGAFIAIALFISWAARASDG
jgi:hypothetical protein